MEDVSCEQRAGDDYNWHSSMPAALKSIVLSKSFCSRPAQPCLAKWKKLKLDSNFRIENWHRGRAGLRWTDLWRCIVWSLVIRSVVTRCGDWPIRGQHSDTWPIRTGDTDHIWQLQPQLSALKKSWILSGPLSRCLVPDMLTITGRIWGLIIAGNNG